MDFFLWPILLPLFIPIVYCIRYKKESLTEVLVIALVIALIIGLWPIYSDGHLGYSTGAYVSSKALLFIVLPIIALLLFKRNRTPLNFKQYGIQKEGLKKSVMLCLILLPVMLIATYIVKIVSNPTSPADSVYGTIMFFEAFTEEFLFRGVLFILLLGLTNTKIAYVTSFAGFLIMHTQYYMNGLDIGLLMVFVQSIATIEIARRSNNIVGSWLLHGINRFFSLAIFPLI